jgi:hypothetical protein
MNHASDTAADGDGTFSPQQAAALLDQTTAQARRNLQPTPPWVLAFRAVLVLAACGAVWLSVRHQNPYTGPTAADVPILVTFIVVNFAVTVGFRQRAGAGVRGPSRLRPAEIAIAALAWVAAVVVLVALAGAGLSYSLHPTTVLIVPGLTWAGLMALRKSWHGCAKGAAAAAVGVAGLFATGAGAWLVAAVGLGAMLLADAVFVARRQHLNRGVS